MARFLFPLPGTEKPTGGVNVILSMIEVLRDSGISAHPVFPTSDYRYDFVAGRLAGMFDDNLQGVFRPNRRDRIARTIRAIAPIRRERLHARLELRADDVIVIPEFVYPEIAALYPGNDKVCLVQAYFSFAVAMNRLRKTGALDRQACKGFISTSEACARAVRIFADRQPSEIVLHVGGGGGEFVETKKAQIAFMPRRLGPQVQAIVEAVKAMPEAGDFAFVSLDRMTHEEVMTRLSESLIFLSFSHRDGFGLPPAEAMACGCVVVGFTGVGGDEFLTPDCAFPVATDNIMEFAERVRDILSRYQADRTALDDIRRRGAEMIRSRYSEARFRETTLKVFRDLDTSAASP